MTYLPSLINTIKCAEILKENLHKRSSLKNENDAIWLNCFSFFAFHFFAISPFEQSFFISSLLTTYNSIIILIRKSFVHILKIIFFFDRIFNCFRYLKYWTDTIPLWCKHFFRCIMRNYGNEVRRKQLRWGEIGIKTAHGDQLVDVEYWKLLKIFSYKSLNWPSCKCCLICTQSRSDVWSLMHFKSVSQWAIIHRYEFHPMI